MVKCYPTNNAHNLDDLFRLQKFLVNIQNNDFEKSTYTLKQPGNGRCKRGNKFSTN